MAIASVCVTNIIMILLMSLNSESSIFQRQCCGPGRAFAMSITDNSQKEVHRGLYTVVILSTFFK